MFAATAATKISGAVAERIKINSFILIAILYVAIVYPIVGSWQWGGGFFSTFISEDLDLSSGSAGTNYGSNIMFLNDRQYDGYNTPIHIYDTDGAEHFGKYIPTLIKDTVKKPTPETESIPVNYLEPILKMTSIRFKIFKLC